MLIPLTLIDATGQETRLQKGDWITLDRAPTRGVRVRVIRNSFSLQLVSSERKNDEITIFQTDDIVNTYIVLQGLLHAAYITTMILTRDDKGITLEVTSAE